MPVLARYGLWSFCFERDEKMVQLFSPSAERGGEDQICALDSLAEAKTMRKANSTKLSPRCVRRRRPTMPLVASVTRRLSRWRGSTA